MKSTKFLTELRARGLQITLLKAFESYADDISELVYLHLDGINNCKKIE